MWNSALLFNRLCVSSSHKQHLEKEGYQAGRPVAIQGTFIRVRWPVLNKKRAKMESSGFKDGPEDLAATARMLRASARRCDVGGLHGDVWHTGCRYLITECTKSVAFRLVLLLFCHFRHISFSFYGSIVSQFHKKRFLFHQRLFECQRMFERISLCVNDVCRCS